MSDYFDPTVDALTALTADMSPKRDDESPQAMEGSTPSRGELYADFPSAYSAITSRMPRPEDTPDRELAGRTTFSPHTALEPGMTGYRTLMSNDNLPNSGKTKHGSTVKQRLSKAWRGLRGSESFRVMDHAVAEHGGELATLPEQQAIAGQGIPSQSAPAGFPIPGEQSASSRPAAQSLSMGRIGLEIDRSAPDDASTYSSAFSYDEYPESFIDPRRSVPYGRRIGETDYSSEAGISSYAYEFGSSPHRRSQMSAQRTSSQKDTTLQNIYDQYRNTDPDLSLHIQGADDDTIHVSPIKVASVPPAAYQSTASLHETVVTNVSSQGSSHANSPKTPESNVFHTPGGHVIYSSAGVPPNVPLPTVPLINQMPPFAPRQTYIPSGVSGISSAGDSYGDTRHLLLLSQNLAEGGPDNASSSSQALPGVQEEDRMSPVTMFRPSPPPRSPLRLASYDSLVGVTSGRVSRASAVSRSPTAFSLNLGYTAEFFDAEGQPLTPRPLRQAMQAGAPSVELPRGARVPSPDAPTSPMSVKSSGVPAMWGNRSPRFEPRGVEALAEGSSGDSFADIDDEGAETDWETVGNPSRPTLAPENTLSSMADYSDASMLGSGPLPVFPSMEHNRTSSCYSDASDAIQPGLAPQPLFEHRNQLSASSTHRDPPTQQDQASHPPPADQSAEQSAEQPEDAEDAEPRMSTDWKFSLHLLHLLDLERAAEEQENRDIAAPHSRKTTSSSDNTDFDPSAFPAGSRLSGLLEVGPNDEIVYERPHTGLSSDAMFGEPSSPLYEITSSPNFTSSPLPEQAREDSFAKLTELSQKANLTGTPNGTNMNETGSSLANTSSPGDAAFTSTPLRAPTFVSSPLSNEIESTPMVDDHEMNKDDLLRGDMQHSPSSGRERVITPLSPSPTARQASETPSPSALSTSREQFETGNLAELRNKHIRDREERLLDGQRNFTETRRNSKRASVQGQTKLMEMRLVQENRDALSPVEPANPLPSMAKRGTSLSTIHTNFDRYGSLTTTAAIGNFHNDSFDTTSPLVAGHTPLVGGRPPLRTLSPEELAIRRYLRESADPNNPRLIKIPRSFAVNEDPELLKRQCRMSWYIFAGATIFPPFLCTLNDYGDSLIAILTSGQITELDRTVKRISGLVGLFLTLVYILVLVIVVLLGQAGTIG